MIEKEEERARYRLCQWDKDEGRRDELSARRRVWEHVLEWRDMRGHGAVSWARRFCEDRTVVEYQDHDKWIRG